MQRKYAVTILCCVLVFLSASFVIGDELITPSDIPGSVKKLSPPVVASSYPAPVPRTGQTTSYGAGDDGALQKGVAWPNPRFTDNNNGTVTDNLTGLIWLKETDCFYYWTDPITNRQFIRTVDLYPDHPYLAWDGLDWGDALSVANSLASGRCFLTDGSQAGDWRLPNRKEFYSLIDFNGSNPALPPGHPFTNVIFGRYWSSTTCAFDPNWAWQLDLNIGVNRWDKGGWFGVWPVRGGQ
ncbi:MAG: DUF1566 domain-containing protein [Deltaproteobacteria bacterium]|nr:DUF1566 domain-containing protein [Deltaproteobacteria bacterium]